jgi:hypothetical protein
MDPLTAGWDDIERAVIKLLGGAFSPREETHQGLAFMLAAAFAERLRRDHGAFWFPNRATPQGAALGFAPGIIVFSPFASVGQALGRGRLALLDEVTTELGRVLAQARARDLTIGGGDQRPLGPEDYQRLFDPGFVQFVGVQVANAKAAWEHTPPAEIRELEDAFSRLGPKVPREASEPFKRQLVEALGQLDAGKPIGGQVSSSPQLAELLGLLHGGAAQTGFAPAELWEGVLLPLLHIGAPASFPDPDEDAVEGYRKGVPPLVLYVDTVPYQTPAADEDGLLGVFPPEEIDVLDTAFERAEGVRLARVDPAPLRDLIAGFDGNKVRAAVESFRGKLQSGAGGPGPGESPAGEPSLLDVALLLLEDLGRVLRVIDEKGAAFCVRHATESEAGSEPLLQELRQALTGPRIIMP